MRTSIAACLIVFAGLPQSAPTFLLPSVIDVVVTDSGGRAVTGLSKEEFAVTQGGEPRTIAGFVPPREPWSVLLLVDNNLVQRYSVNWSTVSSAIFDLVLSMRPNDRFSLAIFDDRVQTLLDWREVGALSLDDILDADTYMQPPSVEGVDLYGALQEVSHDIRRGERRAVVVATDGRDRRLYPLWFHGDGGEVLDPLYGLVDSEEMAAFDETRRSIIMSRMRFLVLPIQADEEVRIGGRGISGLFPGATEATDQYLALVLSRLHELSYVSGGIFVDYSRPWQWLAELEGLFRSAGLAQRYTIWLDDAVSDGEVAVSISRRDLTVGVIPKSPVE